MRESNTKLFLIYKSLKTGQPSYLCFLLSFPFYRSTRSSSLITLSRPSLTSRLKIANRSFHYYAPILWNNLPSHLLRLFITSLLFLFQTRLCLIFQPLFSLRSWKPISFTLPFLLSLYLPRLSQDWYIRYWPSFVFLSHTHFAIIHRHIIHANVIVIWLVSMNKWSLICWTF